MIQRRDDGSIARHKHKGDPCERQQLEPKYEDWRVVWSPQLKEEHRNHKVYPSNYCHDQQRVSWALEANCSSHVDSG